MADLLEWAATVTVSHRSDARPAKARFTAGTLDISGELHATAIRGERTARRPNAQAISIDCAHLAGSRDAYRALGLAMIGYALSEQSAPLRIHLAREMDQAGQIQQLVLWPGRPSALEAALGMRLAVREVHYRPRLLEGNPEYSTTEQDDETYPREHLPYFLLGDADTVESGPALRAGQVLCLHLAGTSPALVWLGKFLLNVALDDSNCRTSYLYNMLPAESLAPGSAELLLTVAEPDPSSQGENPG